MVGVGVEEGEDKSLLMQLHVTGRRHEVEKEALQSKLDLESKKR